MSEDIPMLASNGGNTFTKITDPQVSDLLDAADCLQFPENNCTVLVQRVHSDNLTYREIIDNETNWIYYPHGDLHCVPGTMYKWGFSPGYLWITSFVSSIWVLGMFAL